MLRIGLLASVSLLPVWSQQRVDTRHNVDPGQMYHRVYARVPIIGTGLKDDPKRPMFAPLPSEMKRDHTGVIAYKMLISDDRNFALVEFVGASPKELQHIVSSVDPNVRAFEIGKSSKVDIETEFQKYKKDFKLDNWIPMRPR